jgi:hypothetical protein
MQWEFVRDKNGFYIGDGCYPGRLKTCHYNADRFNNITVGMAECGLYGYAFNWGISTAGAGEPPQASLYEDRCIYRSEREAIAAAVEDLKETLRRFEMREDNPNVSRQINQLIEALDRFEQHFAPAVEQLSLF